MSEIIAINSNISSTSGTSSASSESFQSDDEIIELLKKEGMYATKSVQEVAREFSISIIRAQKILDKINGDDTSGQVQAVNNQEFTVNSDMTNAYSYSVHEPSNIEVSTVEYSV